MEDIDNKGTFCSLRHYPDLFFCRKIALRLLGRGDCAAMHSEMDAPLDVGCRVAIIDLRVFVPEVVSVLATMAVDNFRSHLKAIPFVDGLIGRAQSLASNIDNSEWTLERRVNQAIVESGIEVLQKLSREVRLQIASRVCSLSIVKCLYGTQLDAFVASICNPLHCTHGPPGSGKSFVGVALVLTFIEIKEAAEASGQSLGPILTLSYKNHAEDEFLVDVLKWYRKPMQRGKLIRTGKPERSELVEYTEKSSILQFNAERELVKRLSTLREARKFCQSLKTAERSLKVLSMKSEINIAFLMDLINRIVHLWMIYLLGANTSTRALEF